MATPFIEGYFRLSPTGAPMERVCAELEVDDLDTPREWCGKCGGPMRWEPSRQQRLLVVNRCERCGNARDVRHLVDLSAYYKEPTYALK